jgi:hypothetical protein
MACDLRLLQLALASAYFAPAREQLFEFTIAVMELLAPAELAVTNARIPCSKCSSVLNKACSQSAK